MRLYNKQCVREKSTEHKYHWILKFIMPDVKLLSATLVLDGPCMLTITDRDSF